MVPARRGRSTSGAGTAVSNCGLWIGSLGDPGGLGLTEKGPRGGPDESGTNSAVRSTERDHKR
jgi:hypothetical protein